MKKTIIGFLAIFICSGTDTMGAPQPKKVKKRSQFNSLKNFSIKESQELTQKTLFDLEIPKPKHDPRSAIWDTVFLDLLD